MTTTVLIMASGDQRRFDFGAGAVADHKQLLRIGDESLLERMARQAKERGADRLFVITHHPPITAHAREFSVVVDLGPWLHRCLAGSIAACEFLYSERTVILLGDVVFTTAAMDRIFSFQGYDAFFGNQHEFYAATFSNAGPLVLAAAEEAVRYSFKGKLRNVYQAMAGISMDRNDFEASVQAWFFGLQAGIYPKGALCQWISDDTTDFDTPLQYKQYVEVRGGKV